MTEKLTVLVVDDSDINRSILTAVIGDDFKVIEADCGVKALEILDESHDDIALVLLDILMPGMDGFGVLEDMGKKGYINEIPVIVISTEESSAFIRRAYEFGVTDYIGRQTDDIIVRKRISNTIKLFARHRYNLMAAEEQNESLLAEKYRLENMDELMGCWNFNGFKSIAKQYIWQNPEIQYVLWYCDIKDFKMINNVLGYEIGDKVLRYWVQAISEYTGEKEAIGRITGDRIVALTKGCDKEVMKKRFFEVVDKVNEYMKSLGHAYDVDMAAGAYILKESDKDSVEIVRMLDFASVAHKSIKNINGSQCAIFDDDLWKKKIREAEIGKHLTEALANGEISVWLQPQYDYTTGKMVGAEALCRWNHATLGNISPGEFIPVLEHTGQIPQLDHFIWEEACHYVKKWNSMNLGISMPLSVNVSRADIQQPGFYESIYQLIEKYEIPPSMLRLEITESSYMDEPEQLISVVKNLQSKGFIVEMDDFGSGYSSLNMLKEVSVDILKLDMKFLSESGNDSRGGNILSAVIRMSHSLELPVIAEGVETAEQANFLKNLGCTLMQGYYFAKPMPIADFEKLLFEQHSIGEVPSGFNGPGLKDLNEVLDAKSNSSFVFDRCIGGAILVEYDGSNMDTIMVNDAFYDTVGISRERFEKARSNVLEHIEPATKQEVMAALDEAIHSSVARNIARIPFSGRWIRCTYRHISEGAHSHVLFILLEDITQMHEVQLELDKVTRDYHDQMEQMPGGLFRYEADGEQKFSYISNGMLEMLGYTMEGFKEKFDNSFINMVYIEDRERVFKEIDMEISCGKNTYCEYRIETADGSLKWVYDSGKLVEDEDGTRWYYVIITDMDERKRKLQEQIWQKTMYQSLAMVPGAITYDYDPKLDRFTMNICNEDGIVKNIVTERFLENMADVEWLSPSSVKEHTEVYKRALEMPTNGAMELQCRFGEQSDYRWYRSYYTSVIDTNGKVYRIVGRADDIEQDKQKISAWKKQAEHDTMTNLLNHDASMKYIDRAIREYGGGTMILIDLDNFKKVNDVYGHLAGDRLLKKVAETIRQIFRKEDIIARFGGDEFIVFLPGEHNEKLARNKAEDILKSLKDIVVEGLDAVSCSIGISMTERTDYLAVKLFGQADVALYKSKEDGKGRYTIFDR